MSCSVQHDHDLEMVNSVFGLRAVGALQDGIEKMIGFEHAVTRVNRALLEEDIVPDLLRCDCEAGGIRCARPADAEDGRCLGCRKLHRA